MESQQQIQSEESSEILQLPEEVINQIAAGEVVERPAHLVKELVENSIDAQATEIAIEFSQGGRQIRVVDNGVGISAQNLKRALDRHATSKIKHTEDLWKLKSFGFRGEALASISAVSELTLTSRQVSQKLGCQIVSHYGKSSEIDDRGAPVGTEVQVKNLFENVPARLKFLKTAAAESGKIKTTLKALALANPQIAFRLTQDQHLLHFWPHSTFIKRAESICEVALFEVEGAFENCQVRIYFGDPNTTQKTSKDIWIFAQNRWIQDRSIQAAVMDAYRNLLMHGEFPVCVVFVEVPKEEIDVNIHPTKSQVKFLNPSSVFRAVQRTLREGLEKAPWIQNDIPGESGQAPKYHIDRQNPIQSAVETFSTSYVQDSFVSQSSQSELSGTYFSAKEFNPSGAVDAGKAIPREFNLSGTASSRAAVDFSVGGREMFPPASGIAVPVEANKGGYWSSLQVLGQANLTYILTQSREALVLVDQHAAHERIMFERLMRAWKERSIETQEFLFPLAIDLSSERLEAVMTEKESFARFGVRLEALGPETVGVCSAPTFLKETALHSVIEKTASDVLENGGSFAFEKKLGDIFSTFACHSAIRAGQSLSSAEMKSLLEQMDEFPLSSFCPHGRPVHITYSFSDLEKSFGRIV